MIMPADVADALARMPLIAILRGIHPDEVEGIGEELLAAGFTAIEIPLNSPDPLRGIERLARVVEGRGVAGAGTVLDPQRIAGLRDAGARMAISPNTDTDVIAASVAAGLASFPGYQTLSEAFAALAAGAHALKLFPAEAASPAVLRAHRAVLPDNLVFVVGGVTPETCGPWVAAGAAGAGLGGALYRPGAMSADVGKAARAFVTAWQAATTG